MSVDGAVSRTAKDFWSSVDSGLPCLPFCVPCDAAFFYPRPRCPRCHSQEIQYRIPGALTIRTFTWVWRPQSSAFEDSVPILLLVGESDGATVIAEGRGWSEQRPPRIGELARLVTAQQSAGQLVAVLEPEEAR